MKQMNECWCSYCIVNTFGKVRNKSAHRQLPWIVKLSRQNSQRESFRGLIQSAFLLFSQIIFFLFRFNRKLALNGNFPIYGIKPILYYIANYRYTSWYPEFIVHVYGFVDTDILTLSTGQFINFQQTSMYILFKFTIPTCDYKHM